MGAVVGSNYIKKILTHYGIDHVGVKSVTVSGNMKSVYIVTSKGHKRELIYTNGDYNRLFKKMKCKVPKYLIEFTMTANTSEALTMEAKFLMESDK